MSSDIDSTGKRIKTQITFVIRTISKKNTLNGMVG